MEKKDNLDTDLEKLKIILSAEEIMWGDFFTVFEKFVKNLEQMLEFGSVEEKEDGLRAYQIFHQQINKAFIERLDVSDIEQKEFEKMSQQDGNKREGANSEEGLEIDMKVQHFLSLVAKVNKLIRNIKRKSRKS